MEASRRVPGGNAIIVPDTKALRDPQAPPGQAGPGISMMNRSEFMPLHPHSIPLQIWLELGLPGVIVMMWLILVTFLAPAQDRMIGIPKACSVGNATSYVVVGSLSFGAWQNWWIALGWLSAALISMLASQESTSSREPVRQPV